MALAKENNLMNFADPLSELSGHPKAIAHEVGNLLLGAGHPDEEGGIQPLFGTARTQRLLCSGPKCSANSLLLVKKEWDKAEEWLVQYPDRREQGQE
jgi:hypothetical protein